MPTEQRGVEDYVERHGDQLDQNLVQQLVPLVERLATITILVVAILVVAGYFGVDVVAIGAALGVTGFAIALALKDTISNIFSGLVIMVSRPFAIGDRVDVPSLDAWGDVSDIGIRSTTVKMRDNRLVIVPNSGIVNNVIVNYSRPDPSYRLERDLDLDYGVDMRRAQDVFREAIKALEGVLRDRPIDVWFIAFGASDLRVRVRWWVADYAIKRASTDAVARAVVAAAHQRDIAMPNPKLELGGALDVSPRRPR